MKFDWCLSPFYLLAVYSIDSATLAIVLAKQPESPWYLWQAWLSLLVEYPIPRPFVGRIFIADKKRP
jgi:hypothetical protein